LVRRKAIQRFKSAKKMQWYELEDKRPDDGQQVLVDCDGEILVGWYQASTNTFELRDGTRIEEKECPLKWQEVLRPEGL
jgi:hypothetical protein